MLLNLYHFDKSIDCYRKAVPSPRQFELWNIHSLTHGKRLASTDHAVSHKKRTVVKMEMTLWCKFSIYVLAIFQGQCVDKLAWHFSPSDDHHSLYST